MLRFACVVCIKVYFAHFVAKDVLLTLVVQEERHDKLP